MTTNKNLPTATKEMTRAPKGGCIGVNGETYKGGEFLPLSARTRKGEYKVRISSSKKRPVAPYLWETAPADDMLSIYDRIESFVKDDRKSRTYIKGKGFEGLQLIVPAGDSPVWLDSYGNKLEDKFLQFVKELAEAFNAGQKWYPLDADPFHYLNE